MLSFVVHNFIFLAPILQRTRKLLAYSINLKSPFILSFFHLMLSLSLRDSRLFLGSTISMGSYYYFHFLLKRIWQTPLKLFSRNTGLYTNNLSKSLMFRGLANYSNFYVPWASNSSAHPTLMNLNWGLIYHTPRVLLHFALLKSSFKVISLFFLQYLFYNYGGTQPDFRPHSNYFLLSHWAYFYPPTNSFYFRIYHY
jgi:hypothetical protein